LKRICILLLALASYLIPLTSSAQAIQPTTPTTKILAVGTINAGSEQSKVLALMPNEIRETVNLYLAGRIDQWYSLADRTGVVFVLNMTDLEAAHAMLEQLPLGEGALHEFRPLADRPPEPVALAGGR
jgi:hypothetical protein